MADLSKHALQAMGPYARVAGCRFAPAASPAAQALTEDEGIASVTRTGAGTWTVQLVDTKVKAMKVFTAYIDNGTTHFNVVRCESVDLDAGSCVVSHGSVAFASVASGPSASDTVDQMQVLVLYRVV